LSNSKKKEHTYGWIQTQDRTLSDLKKETHLRVDRHTENTVQFEERSTHTGGRAAAYLEDIGPREEGLNAGEVVAEPGHLAGDADVVDVEPWSSGWINGWMSE
jgi:hypothetical protein